MDAPWPDDVEAFLASYMEAWNAADVDRICDAYRRACTDLPGRGDRRLGRSRGATLIPWVLCRLDPTGAPRRCALAEPRCGRQATRAGFLAIGDGPLGLQRAGRVDHRGLSGHLPARPARRPLGLLRRCHPAGGLERAPFRSRCRPCRTSAVCRSPRSAASGWSIRDEIVVTETGVARGPAVLPGGRREPARRPAGRRRAGPDRDAYRPGRRPGCR